MDAQVFNLSKGGDIDRPDFDQVTHEAAVTRNELARLVLIEI